MISYQVGVKMRSISNIHKSLFDKGLVTIKPGKYPVVGSNDRMFDIEIPTHGLTIEHVGDHVDKSSCWHVLIDNTVLLVWDCDMELR